MLKTMDGYKEDQENDLPDAPSDDALLASRRCEADWQDACNSPAWGAPQWLRVAEQFGLSFSRAALSWLHGQSQASDVVAIRFTFLEWAAIWLYSDLPLPSFVPCMTTPTVATMARCLRRFFMSLSAIAPPKEEGENLLHCGVVTPQSSFPLVVGRSTVRLAHRLLVAFTSHRPVRTSNDLARPLTVDGSMLR